MSKSDRHVCRKNHRKGLIQDIYYNPRHPYTWGLLASIPRLHQNTKQKLVPIWGKPPDLLAPPPGCRFAPRCEYAMKVCEAETPPNFNISAEHSAACWLLDSRAPRVEERSHRSACVNGHSSLQGGAFR